MATSTAACLKARKSLAAIPVKLCQLSCHTPDSWCCPVQSRTSSSSTNRNGGEKVSVCIIRSPACQGPLLSLYTSPPQKAHGTQQHKKRGDHTVVNKQTHRKTGTIASNEASVVWCVAAIVCVTLSNVGPSESRPRPRERSPPSSLSSSSYQFLPWHTWGGLQPPCCKRSESIWMEA